ncbi:MAG: sn-glycerol-3-phosphate ABC transporter ATP-binding protein UgpC [Planctomycetota bacterium]|nr:sn-glycerol-3-phosphate ABC transporter ATP-binding protein UgpC [Planctomycetota bacterium]
MANVRLQSIGKTYPGGVRAVDNLSLEIADGEFVVLVGPSGCGKSTTLRMIAGLESITDGTLFIGDRQVNGVAARDRDIAMVFQDYALYPHMNVGRNLSFGLLRRRKYPSRLRALFSGAYRTHRREERRAIADRVAQAASVLGLEDLLDRHPRALSGGQRQRVALGRAIVRDPSVFLLDEPLSNLDAKLRGEMRTELRRLHRQLGATMVHVTHDQEEAMTLGDRLVVMKDGVVQQCGPPAELYEHPANRFVASFIGTPEMNFLEGVIEDGSVFVGEGHRFALPKDRWSSLSVGQQVTLGIRPEHLALATEGDAMFTGEAEVVEQLGDRTDVILANGNRRMTARIASGSGLREGDSASLRADLNQAHVFVVGDGENRVETT